MSHISLDPAFLRQSEALYTAEEFILRNLRAELRVPDIAEYAQVSPRQLLRMFRDEHHLTVQNFIRKIGHARGVPDLAQFNKLLKRETGAPPRVYRQMRAQK